MWGLRVAWGILALAAATTVVVGATASVGATDLSCSKTGTTGVADHSCSDPVISVVGVWPFAVMAVTLVGPTLVPAIVGRAWLSWLAVLALGVAGAWGVGHWTSVWATLIVGLPVAALGAVVACVESARSLMASRPATPRGC